MNTFLQEASVASGANLSRTENNALAFKSTGSKLVDQFGEAGSHRGRKIADVFGDQAALDDADRRDAVKFIFYLRMITRKYAELGVNRGQGARDESFKRLLFYVYRDEDVFYDNLDLMAYVGSFRDIWDIAVMAERAGISLDWERLFDVYIVELEGDQKDLAIKYLPQIVANSKTKTPRAKIRNRLAKAFARYLGLEPKEYRRLKASGTAHDWQQAISRGEFKSINFGHVPGRALTALTNSKFLKNNGLETQYDKWLQKQPVAKFKGYPYELAKQIDKAGRHGLKPYQKMTIDKQFNGLIELAKQDRGGLQGNVLVALDTSGSMEWDGLGGGVTALTVAKSLAVYFASLNKGAFYNQAVMFDSTSRMHSMSGDSFVDRYKSLPPNAMGSTNFQSVIDLLVKVRMTRPDIRLDEYPDTLLVVSDMQFNPSGGNVSNHKAAMTKLANVFPQDYVDRFKVVWWRVVSRPSTLGTFSSTIEDGGTYFVSGFDGAVIGVILGGEEVIDDRTGKVRQPTAEERVQAALSQPVLELVNA